MPSMARRRIDIEALYAAHSESLLLFLARRTADPQLALDLWAETFAHAAAGMTHFEAERSHEGISGVWRWDGWREQRRR